MKKNPRPVVTGDFYPLFFLTLLLLTFLFLDNFLVVISLIFQNQIDNLREEEVIFSNTELLFELSK